MVDQRQSQWTQNPYSVGSNPTRPILNSSMFSDYYNQSVRKLVVAFGNLFNEIYIRKYKEENSSSYDKIRVPLTYAPKEKFYRRIMEPSSISSNTRIEIVLPRMSFFMTGVVYDPSRKLNKINRRTFSISGENKTLTSRDGVPYNISFQLASFTRSIDENLQIMEKILPYFTPEYFLRINFNEIFQNIAIPVVLDQVIMTEDYEGTMEERRTLINTYSFTAKTYIYGPVSESKVIEDMNIDLYPSFVQAPPYYQIGLTGDSVSGTSGPIGVTFISS